MSRLCLLAITLVLLVPCAARAADCASLRSLHLPETSIATAETVSAGTAPADSGASASVTSVCRVTGVLRPSADSQIRFEVWMPVEGWNHRFLGTGNGGFAGSISYEQMAGYVRRGYATAGTDTGHQADAQDATWAYRHPEKIADFGYRGLHLATERAKAVVQAFYGEGARKAYFDGCSDGGREALMEAQRFPEDYDGILAGAPANDWTHLLAAGIDESRTMLDDPAGFISAMKLPAITAAVLAACDAQDGLKDGILNDPRACRFDPETLLCKNGDQLSCLTAPQVASLKKIYAGGMDSSGHLIFPGLMPGDEAGGWKGWVINDGAAPSNYVQNYFRYMVLNDPTWNVLTANVDASVAAADRNTAQALNATDPDLRRFVGRGGKLILYHGWNDPAISPLNTVAYYGAVQKTLGTKAADSVRLYMVAGMEHCVGGPGPSAFGQLGIPTAAKEQPFGVFTALENWVEKGTVPGELTATKYSAAHAVEMTRPVCPYPETVRYNGTGDAKLAASFTCADTLNGK